MKKELKQRIALPFEKFVSKVKLLVKTKSATAHTSKDADEITSSAKIKTSRVCIKTRASAVLQSLSQVKAKTSSGLLHSLSTACMYVTKKRKQTLIISAIAASAILNVFFLSTISAQFFVNNNIYSYGAIQIQTQTAGLNVYKDSSCSIDLSSLSWGTITPGGSVSNLVYIKNEGSVPLTLTLDTNSWSPTNAPNYISLNWNYNGQTVEPNQVILVRLTLTVSQNINGIQNFDFQININGSS